MIVPLRGSGEPADHVAIEAGSRDFLKFFAGDGRKRRATEKEEPRRER
jgi:hypothetical protein